MTAEGRLQNTATDGAENVELEILDGSGNSVKLGDTSQHDSATTMDISSGAATMNYSVRYYATGVATEGAVTSQVTYTVTYQ